MPEPKWNPEHLEVVKQGAAAIKKFRDENPGVRFELFEAPLTGTGAGPQDLTDADLSDADLAYAVLVGALLERSRLRGAHLINTNLRGARMKDTDLVDVIASEVQLEDADLPCSTLIGASFQRANLRGANLASADLRDADFTGADFSDALLDDVKENQAIEMWMSVKGLSTVIGLPARLVPIALEQRRLIEKLRRAKHAFEHYGLDYEKFDNED